MAGTTQSSGPRHSLEELDRLAQERRNEQARALRLGRGLEVSKGYPGSGDFLTHKREKPPLVAGQQPRKTFGVQIAGHPTHDKAGNPIAGGGQREVLLPPQYLDPNSPHYDPQQVFTFSDEYGITAQEAWNWGLMVDRDRSSPTYGEMIPIPVGQQSILNPLSPSWMSSTDPGYNVNQSGFSIRGMEIKPPRMRGVPRNILLGAGAGGNPRTTPIPASPATPSGAVDPRNFNNPGLPPRVSPAGSGAAPGTGAHIQPPAPVTPVPGSNTTPALPPDGDIYNHPLVPDPAPPAKDPEGNLGPRGRTGPLGQPPSMTEPERAYANAPASRRPNVPPGERLVSVNPPEEELLAMASNNPVGGNPDMRKLGYERSYAPRDTGNLLNIDALSDEDKEENKQIRLLREERDIDEVFQQEDNQGLSIQQPQGNVQPILPQPVPNDINADTWSTLPQPKEGDGWGWSLDGADGMWKPRIDPPPYEASTEPAPLAGSDQTSLLSFDLEDAAKTPIPHPDQTMSGGLDPAKYDPKPRPFGYTEEEMGYDNYIPPISTRPMSPDGMRFLDTNTYRDFDLANMNLPTLTVRDADRARAAKLTAPYHLKHIKKLHKDSELMERGINPNPDIPEGSNIVPAVGMLPPRMEELLVPGEDGKIQLRPNLEPSPDGSQNWKELRDFGNMTAMGANVANEPSLNMYHDRDGDGAFGPGDLLFIHPDYRTDEDKAGMSHWKSQLGKQAEGVSMANVHENNRFYLNTGTGFMPLDLLIDGGVAYDTKWDQLKFGGVSYGTSVISAAATGNFGLQTVTMPNGKVQRLPIFKDLGALKNPGNAWTINQWNAQWDAAGKLKHSSRWRGVPSHANIRHILAADAAVAEGYFTTRTMTGMSMAQKQALYNMRTQLPLTNALVEIGAFGGRKMSNADLFLRKLMPIGREAALTSNLLGGTYRGGAVATRAATRVAAGIARPLLGLTEVLSRNPYVYASLLALEGVSYAGDYFDWGGGNPVDVGDLLALGTTYALDVPVNFNTETKAYDWKPKPGEQFPIQHGNPAIPDKSHTGRNGVILAVDEWNAGTDRATPKRITHDNKGKPYDTPRMRIYVNVRPKMIVGPTEKEEFNNWVKAQQDTGWNPRQGLFRATEDIQPLLLGDRMGTNGVRLTGDRAFSAFLNYGQEWNYDAGEDPQYAAFIGNALQLIRHAADETKAGVTYPTIESDGFALDAEQRKTYGFVEGAAVAGDTPEYYTKTNDNGSAILVAQIDNPSSATIPDGWTKLDYVPQPSYAMQMKTIDAENARMNATNFATDQGGFFYEYRDRKGNLVKGNSKELRKIFERNLKDQGKLSDLRDASRRKGTDEEKQDLLREQIRVMADEFIKSRGLASDRNYEAWRNARAKHGDFRKGVDYFGLNDIEWTLPGSETKSNPEGIEWDDTPPIDKIIERTDARGGYGD